MSGSVYLKIWPTPKIRLSEKAYTSVVWLQSCTIKWIKKKLLQLFPSTWEYKEYIKLLQIISPSAFLRFKINIKLGLVCRKTVYIWSDLYR